MYGLIYVFLVGVSSLEAGIKIMGQDTQESLFSAAGNPVAALCIGILGTVLVQSSSASTSVIVGLVASTAQLERGGGSFGDGAWVTGDCRMRLLPESVWSARTGSIQFSSIKRKRLGMETDPIDNIEIGSVEDFILQFALRTARADIVNYTIENCDLRGPELTQIIRKRTWSRVTYVDCVLDERAKQHVEGTGGIVISTVESSDTDETIL